MSSELFDFDELDQQQDAPPSRVRAELVCTGFRQENGRRCKTFSGTIDVVSGLSGDVLCTPRLCDAARLADVKAAVAAELGFAIELQLLLTPEGRKLADEALISRVVCEARPEVLLLVSPGECLTHLEEGQMDLRSAPPLLRGVREAVLAAVRRDGGQLELASAELQADREVVLAAISAPLPSKSGVGSPLAFAAADLKRDPDVVLAAVQTAGAALQHAAGELQSDAGIVEAAVRRSGAALAFASPELRRSARLAWLALRSDRRALGGAGAELRGDRAFILAAVAEDGLQLEFADDRLRNDREVVLAAARQNLRALQHAGESLRRNAEFRSHVMQHPDVTGQLVFSSTVSIAC